MDTFIVYLDDANYATHILEPMLSHNATAKWVLVACAPRLSHRIGKWLSYSSRESWRNKWCDKLFSQITPTLTTRSNQESPEAVPTVHCVVAKGPLPELTEQLHLRFGTARVIDARRPKFGQELAPVTQAQPQEKAGWQVPGAVGSLSAMLVLAAD